MKWIGCSSVSSAEKRRPRARWNRRLKSPRRAAVIVKAQVPGVSKEHLQVNVTDTTLTLKGDVQEDKTTEDKHYHRREFHYGAFARTITLPTTVQAEHATAQLKDGVVEVTIPKREATTAKDVPIQTEERLT